MSKLTAARRKKLSRSQFALPKTRGYPVDTEGRAVAAKGRATQAVKAGRMSVSTEEKIDAKANRKLHAGKGAKARTGKSRSYIGPGPR